MRKGAGTYPAPIRRNIAITRIIVSDNNGFLGEKWRGIMGNLRRDIGLYVYMRNFYL